MDGHNKPKAWLGHVALQLRTNQPSCLPTDQRLGSRGFRVAPGFAEIFFFSLCVCLCMIPHPHKCLPLTDSLFVALKFLCCYLLCFRFFLPFISLTGREMNQSRFLSFLISRLLSLGSSLKSLVNLPSSPSVLPTHTWCHFPAILPLHGIIYLWFYSFLPIRFFFNCVFQARPVNSPTITTLNYLQWVQG